jgi:chloramphenicol 3-O-phosphotransferase
MSTNTNLTRTGLRTRPSKGRSVNIVRPDTLPQSLFVAELLARRFAHVQRDSFRGQVTPARLSELGDPVLVRSDAGSSEVEAFVRLPGGEIALVDTGYGQVTVEAAAATADAARAAAVSLRRALESAPPPVERVSMAFWMRAECGGEIRHREIEAPSFAEIAANYPAAVGEALARLVATRAPEAGRLILWRGVPGTGKSHAIRALARAWEPWCSTHLIMDPEELLGRGGAYMLDVLTSDNGGPDRWRLLVLEDAGELIAADARAVTGQALSRLLNVADGVIGQGTRTLILITTNEPVGRLHPAARRPGRCLADVEFTPLSVDEANAWLAARGLERRVDQPTPLAELFAEANDRPVTAETAAAPAFGFARALLDGVRDESPCCRVGRGEPRSPCTPAPG